MAYYLPPEIIAKLTIFEVSTKNAIYPDWSELIYEDIRRDNNFEHIGFATLKIKLYSTVYKTDLKLDYNDLESLLELREYINTSDKNEHTVKLTELERYNIFLTYKNKKLALYQEFNEDDYSYNNNIKIRIPEQMLALVDALIDYIEFSKKEIINYKAWEKKMGYEE
jgi:hypothetical protein